MKMFLLPEQTRDAVLAYLMERPFKEVAQGITTLQQLQELPQIPLAPQPPAEEKKKE